VYDLLHRTNSKEVIVSMLAARVTRLDEFSPFELFLSLDNFKKIT
jgi:hypothetical protein